MPDTELLLSDIYSLGDWGTWGNCIRQVKENIDASARFFDRENIERVCLVGCGTSYYAGLVGKYIINNIANIPADSVPAFSFANYSHPSLFYKDILVIGISTTGETQATCDALLKAQQMGAKTLAITAVPDSRITRIARTFLFIGENSGVIVKTRNYVQTLIALYQLAIDLSKEGSQPETGLMNYWMGQFRIAQEATQRFLDGKQAEIDNLVEIHKSAENIFILGNGPNVGTAEEAALKVIEMTKMYSDGCEMEDFFHGRDREIVTNSPVIFLAPQNNPKERMLDFLAFNCNAGISSIVITCQEIPELNNLTDQVIFLNSSLDELATPLLYITPLYLFSYHLALKRGYDPISRRYPVPALKFRYRESGFEDNIEV
jgi:glucosamine--fructose-6-phosphate aminotransferase (isomerizing)